MVLELPGRLLKKKSLRQERNASLQPRVLLSKQNDRNAELTPNVAGALCPFAPSVVVTARSRLCALGVAGCVESALGRCTGTAAGWQGLDRALHRGLCEQGLHTRRSSGAGARAPRCWA